MSPANISLSFGLPMDGTKKLLEHSPASEELIKKRLIVYYRWMPQ
jgi:hypothetical protein